MSKWHDFLLEYAKFPFPHPDEDISAGTTDISQIEVGWLRREWKANHAVRDDTLVQKLCHTLKDILGETLLAADAESYLLASFLPRILKQMSILANSTLHDCQASLPAWNQSFTKTISR